MSISKVTGQGEARIALEEMERLRKRAARQARKNSIEAVEAERVVCEILPLGDGRVSMGEHFGGDGEAYYEAGEQTVPLPQQVAVALYERGYVNFPEAKTVAEKVREERLAAARARRDAQRRAQEEAEAAELQAYA
jgi:hypothetical protein